MKWSKLDLFSVIQIRVIFLNKANLERLFFLLLLSWEIVPQNRQN